MGGCEAGGQQSRGCPSTLPSGLSAKAQLWDSKLMAQKNLQRKLGLTTLVWDRDRGCSIPEPNQQEASKRTRPRDAKSRGF